MAKLTIKQRILRRWNAWQDKRIADRIRRKYRLKIMSSKKTIKYILKNNCSIARYGDGELGIMLESSAPTFQKKSEQLALLLKSVFVPPIPENLLICLLYTMVSARGFRKGPFSFCDCWCRETQPRAVTAIRELMQGEEKTYCFGDSLCSRPFSGVKSNKNTKKMFSLLKQLWNNRDVLFVEGEASRLGVGNDLFDNAKSIKRILAPAENAFDSYDKILETVLSKWNGELIIIALGPTATVLAWDLAKRNIQALDLGHIDIQYEWFLRGKAFTPVQSKYANEAIGGRVISECNDEEYLSQIIAKVDVE